MSPGKRKEGSLSASDDESFYHEVWAQRPKICYESRIFLGSEPLRYMFHHVLEKEKYPHYRHSEWNILLLSLSSHEQVHLNIDKCPKVKTYRDVIRAILESGRVPTTYKALAGFIAAGGTADTVRSGGTAPDQVSEPA